MKKGMFLIIFLFIFIIGTGFVYAESCIGDSDGGKDYYKQGNLNMNCIAPCGAWFDSCINDTTLLEYFCNGTAAGTIYYECTNGCVKGACLKTGQIACYKNEDCGGFSIERYCSNDNSCTKEKNPVCKNPRTSQAKCSFEGGENCSICEKGCRGNSGLCNEDGNIVGNDSDSHGCKGSAGYSWCEEKQKCLRIWEENCSTLNTLPSERNCNNDRDCPQPNCGGEADCVGVINKCVNRVCILQNRAGKVKILPEVASATARERLGELGFNVTLKEVGKGNETKPYYEVSAVKEGKMLGLFKIKGKVSVDVDAETGEVIKVHKPWWAFLASGI